MRREAGSANQIGIEDDHHILPRLLHSFVINT